MRPDQIQRLAELSEKLANEAPCKRRKLVRLQQWVRVHSRHPELRQPILSAVEVRRHDASYSCVRIIPVADAGALNAHAHTLGDIAPRRFQLAIVENDFSTLLLRQGEPVELWGGRVGFTHGRIMNRHSYSTELITPF